MMLKRRSFLAPDLSGKAPTVSLLSMTFTVSFLYMFFIKLRKPLYSYLLSSYDEYWILSNAFSASVDRIM